MREGWREKGGREGGRRREGGREEGEGREGGRKEKGGSKRRGKEKKIRIDRKDGRKWVGRDGTREEEGEE